MNTVTAKHIFGVIPEAGAEDDAKVAEAVLGYIAQNGADAVHGRMMMGTCATSGGSHMFIGYVYHGMDWGCVLFLGYNAVVVHRLYNGNYRSKVLDE